MLRHSAAVGDVALAWDVTLRFGGHLPEGLPSACHSVAVCLPPVPSP